jgi:UDP-N-acetylmuramoyl-tripeptide--D-alanyl-D-alanine ligase
MIGGISYTISGTKLEFTHDSNSAVLTLPFLLPTHFAYSFAAALCIHIDEGESLDSGCTLLEKHFSLPPSRMSLLKGIHDSTIIDSSYNSSPQPLSDSLMMLKTINAKRKIALLGDMRELGSCAETEHCRAINTACRVCDELVLVGPLMREYGLPIATKLHFQPIAWFESAEKAGNYLKGVLQKGDVLLVKGSQNTIFLEMAVELLLNHPEDRVLLCRQEGPWKNVKSSLTN